MPTTDQGLWYPDRTTGMSLEAIVKQSMESVDEFLTPSVAGLELVGDFKGSLQVIRSGPIVVLTGGITRPNWSGGSTHIATLPYGMAPPAAVVSMVGSTRTGEASYQASAQPDGRILFQMSGPSANTNGVNMAWAVGAA